MCRRNHCHARVDAAQNTISVPSASDFIADDHIRRHAPDGDVNPDLFGISVKNIGVPANIVLGLSLINRSDLPAFINQGNLAAFTAKFFGQLAAKVF